MLGEALIVKNNRILKEDVQNFIDGKAGSVKSATSGSDKPVLQTASALHEPLSINETAFQSPVANVKPAVGDRVEPVRGIKKAMVKSMTAALRVGFLFVFSLFSSH